MGQSVLLLPLRVRRTDRSGKQVLSCGAQAAAYHQEQGGPCHYVQHFKMHLHPKRIVEENNLPLEGQTHHIVGGAYITLSTTGAL